MHCLTFIVISSCEEEGGVEMQEGLKNGDKAWEVVIINVAITITITFNY